MVEAIFRVVTINNMKNGQTDSSKKTTLASLTTSA
jgi:hypothetical protein